MKKFLFVLFAAFLAAAASAQLTNRDGYSIWQGRMSIGKQTLSTQSPWTNSWLEIGDSGTTKSMILPRVTSTSIIPAKIGYFHLDLSDGFLHYRNATGDHVIADTALANSAMRGKTISGVYTSGGILFTRQDGSTYLVSGFAGDSVTALNYSSDTIKLQKGSLLPALSTVIPLSTKLNIADTTNRWVSRLTKIGDSVFFYRGTVRTFAYMDSTTQADGNNYVNGAGLTGDVLTITRTGLPAVTATIPLSSKLNFTDTLSMLAAYINSSGYGLVKSGHLLGVDSSFVATRNFVQGLPSYSINNSDITAWGTAYNKRPINLTVTGGATKSVQLTLADGSQLTGSFVDNSGTGSGGGMNINSDTATAQFLAAGVTGADFNIVNDGSGVHQFNLPFATIHTNGKLDSTSFLHLQQAHDFVTSFTSRNIYLTNKGNFDTVATNISDSIIGFKSINVEAGDNVTITKVITDSTIKYHINSAGGSFTDNGFTSVLANKKLLVKDTASNQYFHANLSVMNTTGLRDNDQLKYDSIHNEWVNYQPTSGGGGTGNYEVFSSVSSLKSSSFYGAGKAAKITDGGREYAWNASSTTADDNGITTIQITSVTTGRFERIFSGVVRAAEVGVKSDGTDQTSLLSSIFSNASVKQVLFDNGDVKVLGTVNFQNKKVTFQNNARLTGSGTVRNMQVIADHKTQIFDTTLNTDAGILTKPVSIMWWGASPQADYYTGNGIDNYNAITRAIASQKLQTSVYIPGADTTDGNLGYYYYSSRPISVSGRIDLFGDGAGRSIIYIPGDSLGLWMKWGSSGSHLHDFGITGNYGSNSPGFNSSTAHGIWVNSNSNIIERVTVQYFSGDGIFINGDVGGTPYTNANNNKLKDVFVYENGRHGLDFQGGDANNCSVENVDATGNAQVNIADRSFLGNRFSACHAASAAIDHPLNKSVVLHGGNYYLARENSLGIEPGVTSGWQTYWELKSPFSPSFSSAWNSGTQYYQTAGYLASDPNQLGHFDDCYAEGDQIIVINKGSSTFMSGFAAAYGSTDGAIGSRQGVITSKNYQAWNFVTGKGLRLDAGDVSLQWVDGIGSYPMGFTGNASAGTFSTTWANGAGGSANTFFATPTWTGWTSYLGRDRGMQGNHVHLIQQGGALIGTHDYGSTARLIAFGAAAPTTGDFGIGDVVVNTNPASSVLMWQCSVASITGNGGTWTAVNKGGSGGETLAQTLVLGNNTGANDIAVEWASANRKIDFRYDASFNQGIEFQTMERTMKLYSNTGDATGGDIILSPENRLGIRTPTAPSYDVDIYGSASATNGIYLNAGAGYTGVPNPGSVQGVVINVRGFNLGNAGVSLGGSYQPNLGLGITDNSSTPLVGLKQAGAGTAITVESGAIRQVPLSGTGTRIATLDANGDMGRSTIDPASILSNPMTSSGDMIYGGASGVPTRLAAGTNGFMLSMVSGVPSWVNGANWGGLFTGGSISSGTTATIASGVQYYISTASSTATYTLPALATSRAWFLKNAGSANMVINRAGSDVIWTDASVTTFTLAPGQSAMIVGGTTSWYTFFYPSSGGAGQDLTVGTGLKLDAGTAYNGSAAKTISIKGWQEWTDITTQTTNTTATTIATFSCPVDASGTMVVEMVATQNNNGKSLEGRKTIHWHSTGGTVTVDEIVDEVADYLRGFTTADWTVDASSGTLRIRATGEASTTIDWSPTYKIKYNSYAL